MLHIYVMFYVFNEIKKFKHIGYEKCLEEKGVNAVKEAHFSFFASVICNLNHCLKCIVNRLIMHFLSKLV